MLNAILNPVAADCDGRGIWYDFWDKEIAWMIVIAIAFITASVFLYAARQATKHQAASQRKVFVGFGMFVIGFAIARILFIFSDIERWNSCETPLFFRFVLLSYTVGIFSSLALMIVIERDILQYQKGIMSKFYLSMALIALVMAIFSNYILAYIDTIRLFNTIISVFGSAVLMVLFLRIIFQSTGVIRTNATLNFLGIVIIFIGVIIDGDLVIRRLNIPIWTPAIFPMIGFLLIMYNQFKSVKNIYGE
jgi:MFS family permease